MKKTIFIGLITALVILSSNQAALAQTELSRKTALSETEKQLIYSRGFEAILWASPTLAVYCQAEAGTCDLGAGHLDMVYMGKTPESPRVSRRAR